MNGVSRAFLCAVGAVAANVTPLEAAFAQEDRVQSGARPNVVLIVADDLGYGEVSCYPQTKVIRTPNIDRVAEGGIRMTEGYSADPMCLPSRASLLTGKYHQRFKSLRSIPSSERIIGEYLGERGYATGCIGKWHNCVPGTDLENGPLRWGFDEFFGFLGGMHDYLDPDKGFQTGKGWIYMPVYNGTKPVEKAKYLTEEFTDRAIDFMGRHRGRPFFLYLAYNAKHTPLQVPEEYLERSGGDVNAAMIETLDEGVGRVLDALGALDIEENTVVFFVGDNGGWPSPNWRLRSLKGRLFEGGIRVPFLVRWPSKLPAGRVFSAPVMHIDVLPTILAAAGVEVPEGHGFDGKDLLPYWLGTVTLPPHEVLFWGRGERFAVRRGDWKLVCDSEERQGQPELGLYDLSEDAEEEHNLLAQEKETAEELLRLHREWSSDVRASASRAGGRDR